MKTVVKTMPVGLASLCVVAAVGCSQSTPGSLAVESTQPATATATVGNAFCPIMGGTVSNSGRTVAWNGGTIGFCCDGCDEKWQALSDAEKARKFAAAWARAEDGSDHEGRQQDTHDHS